MSQSLFSQPLNVINVGIAMFSDDLKKQHVEVTQLDWTPPGQGNMQVVQALDNIADSPLADKIAAANQQALDRVDIATMTRYMQEGHFPPGSMLPKIIASLTFLEQGGKEVIITTPECLPAALRGETGTHIIKT
ncbi:hypothetical protein JFX92_14715 [Escherichia coli]|nr:hypothetical protein [Escherichia coli]HAI8142861.1 hypothetical protein [Escherichia coli]HAI8152506.1 hypothetical protein [Escherichia coli]HEC4912240.1 hypothetical protein [Escherichia coli]